MAVNLNDLPIEPVGSQPDIDFNNYSDAQEFAPPPPEGNLNFKTVKAEVENFEQSTGIITVVYDHEAYDINTGAKVGTINFDRVSTKVFQRNNTPASMGADMLRAIGVTQRPSSPREWAGQLLSVKTFCDQGNFWVGYNKWDGYCTHEGTAFETQFDAPKGTKGRKPLPTQAEGHRPPSTPKGAKNWPVEGANGSEHRATEVPCSICGQPIQARAKIDRRIPKS